MGAEKIGFNGVIFVFADKIRLACVLKFAQKSAKVALLFENDFAFLLLCFGRGRNALTGKTELFNH